MARCQRVALDDGFTWTVVDDAGLVLEPVEEYLEFGRQSLFSANTIRSYATALALWMSHLDLHGRRWDLVEVKDLAGFAGAVRRGSVGRLDVGGPARVGESTVAARVRPVLSFYRFQQASGRTEAADSMFQRMPLRPGQRYLPFLAHVERRTGRDRPVLRLRPSPREIPVVPPAAARDLLTAESTFDAAAGSWSGDLRYRLLWALLLETGLRLGEALSLAPRLVDRSGRHRLGADRAAAAPVRVGAEVRRAPGAHRVGS